MEHDEPLPLPAPPVSYLRLPAPPAPLEYLSLRFGQMSGQLYGAARGGGGGGEAVCQINRGSDAESWPGSIGRSKEDSRLRLVWPHIRRSQVNSISSITFGFHTRRARPVQSAGLVQQDRQGSDQIRVNKTGVK